MTDSGKPQRTDHAGVRVPPPLIFLLPLLVGLAVDSAWTAGHLAAPFWMMLGAFAIFMGVAMVVAAAPRFKRAQTSIEPWKPTTTIIVDGVYGYSRNPIYIAMALVYAGIAIAGGSLTALLLLLPCLAAIRFYVIAREEAYLEAKFGEPYRQYKARVRRWL